MHTIDFNFFPGYTRKCVTFSIDDGNVTYDRRFLQIVNEAGMRGTFNLCSHSLGSLDAQGYRELYRGHEIANHVHFHPYAMTPEREGYAISEAPFVYETAAPRTLYKTDIEGFYRFSERERSLCLATAPAYMRLTERSRLALEAIFGEGRVTGFVWPYHEQNNAELITALKASGVAYMRKTGSVKDSTSYAFPAERMSWSYNANHAELVDQLRAYMAYPDDGQLKFFCFGVHSIDFERADNWEDLQQAGHLVGHRPQEYYCAPVIELFRYEDAVCALRVSDEGIENASDVTLFGLVDGERVTLDAHTMYRF